MDRAYEDAIGDDLVIDPDGSAIVVKRIYQS